MRALVVCPVLPYPPVTGGQKRTLRLLEAIERAGGSPHVLTADDGDTGAAEALRARGWAVDVVHEAPPTARRRIRQHLERRPSPYLAGVAARIRELAPGSALVQLEHTQSAYYAAAGVPTVLSLHNLDSRLLERVARSRTPGTPAWARDWNRALATRATERRAFPHADLVVCVSREDAGAAAAAGARTLLAPNGVDPEFFAVGPAAAAPRAAFFGAFGYEPNARGLERFLARGWPEVRRLVPDATLAIAGAGLDPARFGGHDGVEMLGLVDDVAELLAGAAAVVVPVWEGGGTRLKVLEALAAARPVASTAVGVEGIGVTDGREALLADDPRELGAALARLLSEGEAAARMGAAGRALAEPYRWERALADLEHAYRGYLNDRRETGGPAKA
jgi:glycosyltransferase involved in cell wall biosynthesis